jgi:hypothetical protein
VDKQTIAIALGGLLVLLLLLAWMSQTGRLESTPQRDAEKTQEYQRPTPGSSGPGRTGGGLGGPGRECDGDRRCEFGSYCTDRGVCVKWGEK